MNRFKILKKLYKLDYISFDVLKSSKKTFTDEIKEKMKEEYVCNDEELRSLKVDILLAKDEIKRP